MTTPSDHVRQRSSNHASFALDSSDYVNLSDAVRAANEEEPVQQRPFLNTPIGRFLAHFIHVTHLIITLPQRVTGFVWRTLFRQHRCRHIMSTAYTDKRVLEANMDDTHPMHLGPACWLSDLTLSFTYQDFCGFCGSPMKNDLSTPRIVEGGQARAAAPVGLLEGMNLRHRVLLMSTELFFLASVAMMSAMGAVAYSKRMPIYDGYLTSAGITFAGYWLSYWQPRLGMLTTWGWMGRLLCQLIVV
ncbi:hypothetical protein MGN70_002225 [Eutypa lata]|uniref:Uncharacterized protein n=1 Tax=Eutypa lata (strain UCR-EL1) TaxID=1287681 RepID=M7T5E3_EUTLA|nr:hypothetical protein UCREL1_1096 [Eutypa lata UCREL1]KAI1256064.1 hypothetical protein MGN70_002225 [Eutypa lata]